MHRQPPSGASRNGRWIPGRLIQGATFCVALFCTMLPMAAQESSDVPRVKRERYVPADQLDVIFERTPNGVMLPRDEFDDLLRRAQEARATQAERPLDIVIRSAAYAVQLQDAHAVIDLVVDIEQFADEWQALSIPVGNLLVEEAQIGGAPAAVSQAAMNNQSIRLLHSKSGRFQLKLKLSTPVGSVGSDQVVAFHVVPHVVSSVSVLCPAGLHLKVNNLQMDRPSPVAEPATYVVPTGSMQQVQLRWTSRRQENDSQTLVFVRTDSSLQVSADTLRMRSDSRVSVFGNSINQLIARVPSSLEITAVDSTGLESWKLEDDPEEVGLTRVVLTYRQPFTEDRLVSFSAVAALDSGVATRIPTLQFVNVTAHVGRLLVAHADQLRLLAEVGSGIRQLPASELPQSRLQDSVFDFWLQNFELSVAVRPRDRELFGEVNSMVSLVDTTATFQCEMTIETLNAPLFEIPFQLPAGWQLNSVTGENGDAVNWRQASEADTILVEPLSPVPANGLLKVILSLTRTIPDPSSAQQVALPVIVPSGTLIVGGTYQITAADDLDLAPQDIVGLVPIDDQSGSIMFETQGTSYSGTVAVVRKPTRISTRSELRTWMDTRQKTTVITVTADIVNGTTRTLDLALPEHLGENVRFHVVSLTHVPGVSTQQIPASLSIVEQSAGAVADGVRSFSLKFSQRFLGAVTLSARIPQARTADTSFAAPFVRVAGAVRQHGLVVFEADPDQQLKGLEITGLEQADAGLVAAPAAATGRRVALVYRYIDPTYSLTLDETRFDTAGVPSAVCDRIRNISVLSDSDSIQRSSRVHFRCVGVQTLRFTLPQAEQSFLWSTALNGESVEVRRDGSDYLVAIPTEGNTEHVLEVLFESRSAAGTFGRTQQQSLGLSIDTEPGSAAPIEILEQTWDVNYPRSSMLLAHEGGFHPLGQLDEPGWLQSVAAAFRRPTPQGAFNILVPISIVLLMMFVVTTLICRRRWITLASVMVVGLLLVPMFLMATFKGTAARSSVSPTDSASAVYSDEAVAFDFETPNESSPASRVAQPMAPKSEGRRRFDGRALQQEGATAMGGMAMPGAMMGGRAQDEGAGEGLGAVNPGAGGAFGGMGMGGGGFGGQQDGSETSNDPQLTPPVAGDPFTQGAVTQNAGAPAENEDMAQSAVPDRTPRKGSARLSIRTEIAQPDDYRSVSFRSLGGTETAGTLNVVIQQQDRLDAVRILVALLVVLMCMVRRSASWTTKFCFVVGLSLVATAVVPLVPNQWQSALDGVVLGAVAGMGLWIVTSGLRCIDSYLHSLRASGTAGRWKRNASTSASIALMAASVAGFSDSAGAAPQDAATPQSASAARQPDEAGPEVVLPYTSGQSALMADQVFLERDEFLKLYNQAYPGVISDTTQNHEGGVVAAFYKSGPLTQVDASRWLQQFAVRYVVRSFHRAPMDVALPLRAVAVQSVKMNGVDAVLSPMSSVPGLQAEPAGQNALQSPVQSRADQSNVNQQMELPKGSPAPAYQVRVPGKGVHLLDVVFAVAAQIDGPTGRIDLPVLPVSAGTAQFTLPDENLTARVNGRSNLFRRDGRIMTIPISAATMMRIQWQPQAATKAADAHFNTTVNSALTIDDSGLTLQATVTATCRQGELTELQMSLPAGYSVQDISGPDIAGWNVTDTEMKFVNLMFRQPITSDTKINLQLFASTVITSQRSTLDVPILSVTGAARDTGNVSVLGGRELEIRTGALSGVSQINPAEATQPEGMTAELPRVLAWRYTRHPATAAIRVSRTGRKLTVSSLHGVQLEAQRQLWTSKYAATIVGAPLRRIEIEVPQSFVVLNLDAHDLADWYMTEADGSTKILNIQFQTAKLGTVSAVVQGQSDRETDRNSASINAPRVRGTDVSTSRLSIWLDAASEIAGSEADGWNLLGAGQVDGSLRALQTDAPDISFTSQSANPSPVRLSLRQATSSLLPQSVSVTNVTDTSLDLVLGLKWKISRAATSRVSFTLPDSLSDVFDFRVPNLRQMEKTAADDGRVRFTFHLQQPVSESLFVMGTGTLPLPEDRQIRALPPEFVTGPSESGTATIASQSHFWVIVNQSNGLLEAVDLSSDGDDVSLDQIAIAIPEGFLQQSVAIRRLDAAQSNSEWRIRYPQRQQMSPAVVALAAHETVIADDGTWRSRHRLQVRNESRQFLPVEIPEDSRFLYCTVKGQPSRIVTQNAEDQQLHLIAIPQSGELAAPFEIEFSLAGTFPASAGQLKNTWQSESLSIPIPVFPEYRDNPEFGITVSRNTWSVYVPDSWHSVLTTDPRHSNVVAASEADFQDTVLLSNVDNVKSLLNSYKSFRGKAGKDRIISELYNQRQSIAGQQGQNRASEEERSEALQQVDELFARQSGGGAAVDRGQSASRVQVADGVTNFYLMDQEAVRNDFNRFNNDKLWLGNSARPAPQVDASGKGKNESELFQFGLPEKPANEKAPAGQPEVEELGKALQDQKTESRPSEEQSNRSRLLQRRESNIRNQKLKSESQTEPGMQQRSAGQFLGDLSELSSDAPARAGRGEVPQNTLPFALDNNVAQQPSVSGRVIRDGRAEDFDVISNALPGARAKASGGLLSLQFQIPTDGARYDFIRPGGNARLTLSVRSSTAIQRGIGLLWAAGCLLGVILVFRAARTQGISGLVQRSLLLLTIAWLLGALFLPSPEGSLCAVLCVITALGYCLTWIVLTRRSRSKATEPLTTEPV